ncbi:MAG: cytochrome P460 family protein [Pseudomonadota bacterium]
MKTLGLGVAGAALAFGSLFVTAMSGGGSARAAESDAIPQLVACQSCHGVDGISTLPFAPHLAGQRSAYIEAQLQAFRSGDRKSEFMNPIAEQLNDEQITALSGFFSRLPREGTADDAARSARALTPLLAIPASFPDGFSVYTRADDAENGAITRRYANGLALNAARAGTPMPDGSMIVVETTAALRDVAGNVTRGADGQLVPGAAQSYAVSASSAGWGDAIPEVLRNGNWHYGQFDANRAPQTRNQAICLACHKPQEARSFVFTYDALAHVPH